jgi:alpha-L-fucosidase
MAGLRSALAALMLGVLLAAAVSPARAAAPEGDEAGADRMAWWREARFGMFIHWGATTVLDSFWKGETGDGTWILHKAHVPVSEYKAAVASFNPVKYDPDAWARTAKEAGCGYVVLVARHHDGFCNWDSKVSEFDIANTPWKKDIIKPLAEACRKQGLKFGLYYSILDWTHPDYLPRPAWNDEKPPEGGPKFERFVEYVRAQVAELITAYQPDILWFDGEWESTWTSEHAAALEKMIRSMKPDIIINNRIGKGRSGMAGMTAPGSPRAGDFGTPEQEVPSRALPGVDWESCMTIGDAWFFRKSDHGWKPATKLIRTLCDVAGKGGNLLLNVGPTSEGEFPPESAERLHAIGEWMRVNGESIRGTCAGPFGHLAWGSCTVRAVDGGSKLYLQVFDWPEDGRLVVPGLRSEVRRAYVLTAPSHELKTERAGDDVVVTLPARAGDAPQVVVLDVPGKLDVTPPVLRVGAEPAVLDAESAVIDGKTLRVEWQDGKPNLAYWRVAEDSASWPIRVEKAGKYRVEMDYSCAAPSAGNAFVLTVGGAKLEGDVAATGGWKDFKTIGIGTVNVGAGDSEVKMAPRGAMKHGLMNLRAIRLVRED